MCSFILNYLKEVPKQKKEMHLFNDNCWVQNNNHTLVRKLLTLTDITRLSIIILYFPVFLPCGRDFAIIKRKLRKSDRIFSH